jgi:hypothetical protein
MTIIMVDSTVVPTDSENEVSSTGTKMSSGIDCGETSRPNSVIPSTESAGIYLFICHEEPPRTYRPKIKDQRASYRRPTAVAYDPAPPNLQVKSY